MSVFDNQGNNGLQQLLMLKQLAGSQQKATSASGVASMQNAILARQKAEAKVNTDYSAAMKLATSPEDMAAASADFITSAETMGMDMEAANELVYKQTGGKGGALSKKTIGKALRIEATDPSATGARTLSANLALNKGPSEAVKGLMASAKKLGLPGAGSGASLASGAAEMTKAEYDKHVDAMNTAAWNKAPAHIKQGYGTKELYMQAQFKTRQTDALVAKATSFIPVNQYGNVSFGPNGTVVFDKRVNELMGELRAQNQYVSEADLDDLNDRLLKIGSDALNGVKNADIEYIKQMEFGTRAINNMFTGGGVSSVGDEMSKMMDIEAKNLPSYNAAVANYALDIKEGYTPAQSIERVRAMLRTNGDIVYDPNLGSLKKNDDGSLWGFNPDPRVTPLWAQDMVTLIPTIHQAERASNGKMVFHIEGENGVMEQFIKGEAEMMHEWGDWLEGEKYARDYTAAKLIEEQVAEKAASDAREKARAEKILGVNRPSRGAERGVGKTWSTISDGTRR